MTVLGGQHTAEETKDLVLNKDFVFARIAQAFSDFEDEWQAKDAEAIHAWRLDWDALNARYQKARDAAQVAFERPQIPGAINLSEDEWNGILDALTQHAGQVTPGDLQDVYARLVVARGKGDLDFTGAPQPTAPDRDLASFKMLDRVTQTIDHSLGALADAGKHQALGILVGAGLALAAVAALKVALR